MLNEVTQKFLKFSYLNFYTNHLGLGFLHFELHWFKAKRKTLQTKNIYYLHVELVFYFDLVPFSYLLIGFADKNSFRLKINNEILRALKTRKTFLNQRFSKGEILTI